METGPGSAAHEAALEIMPVVKLWGNKYLQGMTPSGAYAKGTAVSLSAGIDILVPVNRIPGMEIREVFWSLFQFLSDRNFHPHGHSVAMRIQHKGIGVDLIPAYLVEGSVHEHILFHKDSGAGVRTNVAKHARLVGDSGRGQDICALKIWRECNKLNFPSLYLELAALHALEGERFGHLAENVLAVLRYLSGNFAKVVVRDPANADNVISDDIDAGGKKDIARAARGVLEDENWKKILW
jgi:hypothetical protein